MLVGVATRQYERSLEPLGADVRARGDADVSYIAADGGSDSSACDSISSGTRRRRSFKSLIVLKSILEAFARACHSAGYLDLFE